MMNLPEYFATARERYTIYLKRQKGAAYPWTEDPVFQQFRFCNVFRELDHTTLWFREHIREPLNREATTDEGRLKLVEATLIFRWFNRIETGSLVEDLFFNGWDTEEARRRLEYVQPIVTGAYMIKSPDGASKLDGLLYAIEMARKHLPSLVPTLGDSIEKATDEFASFKYLGPFLAYEIVTDLRHTKILDHAEDIMTWANPGPGCARGYGWMIDNDQWLYNRHRDRDKLITMMQDTLAASKKDRNWPKEWPSWEMRECEHWACEYDKWKRGHAGERLKRRYSVTEG